MSSRTIARPTDEYCLSIYKTKVGTPSHFALATCATPNTVQPPMDLDWEPSHQWPLSFVTRCEVQTLAHRKQGPVLPTLIITISDQQRKRRSSRAANLISSSSSSETTLWFRSPNDEPHVSLHEWVRFITSKRSAATGPESPISPVLTNPFSPKPRDASDYFPRPKSGNLNQSRSLHHKTSTATYSTMPRERPLTFSSESPSLRSKRSDVSSPSSYNYSVQQMAFPVPGQHYTTVGPTDLPSPKLPAGPGEYQGDFIEGWTSAQGRSSTVSSPTRGRDSISSHAQQPSVTESSSPPAPRETILDRAFQLRCIPGSELDTPGEEKLSSLARFDALMRDVDERRKEKAPVESNGLGVMRSTFDADDSSDGEPSAPESDTDSDGSENYLHEQDSRAEPSLIPPTTQRALKFIASRHDLNEAHEPGRQRRQMSRNPVSFHGAPMTALMQPPPDRPHTAHARSRPRQQSDPAPPPVPELATRSPGLGTLTHLHNSSRPSDETTIRPSVEKRQSSSSTKRLSFNDFTKRLSSTSSLLLVQTNASSGSSRSGGGDVDASNYQAQLGGIVPRSSPGIRSSIGPPPHRDWERDEQDKRCGWRGSVGVLGSDGGGFL